MVGTWCAYGVHMAYLSGISMATLVLQSGLAGACRCLMGCIMRFAFSEIRGILRVCVDRLSSCQGSVNPHWTPFLDDLKPCCWERSERAVRVAERKHRIWSVIRLCPNQNNNLIGLRGKTSWPSTRSLPWWPALWQVSNTLVPYAALWCLMYFSLRVSWWLAVPLAVLAGGFLVRVFIIFHDCGHGSFLSSARANDALGFITGVLTFTPYYHWRWEHAIHHANSGDLDQRGTGDVWTLTVQEYLEASRWKRFAYRLARNPVILFGLAPLYLFLIHQRFPNGKAEGRERHSVWLDESGVGGAGRRAELVIRPQGVFAAAIDRGGRGRVGGGLVVLCAASVRGGVLGAQRGMGLRPGGLERQFVLQAAEGAAVVFGQHRVPPHPPPEPAAFPTITWRSVTGRSRCSRRSSR